MTGSMDVMADDRAFGLSNVSDDVNGEGLGIEADFSVPGEGAIRRLDRIIKWRETPLS